MLKLSAWKKLKEHFKNKRGVLNKEYTVLYSGLKLMIYVILTFIVKYYGEIDLFNKIKHRLNNSILLNNYIAVYLINDVSLLKSGSVKQIKLNECMEASTTIFVI